MGLFLDLTGIAGTSRVDVETSIRQYVERRAGVFEPARVTADDLDVVAIEEAPGGKVSVVHRGSFMQWGEVSAHLSRSLHVPVFSLSIHDGDFWMYVLLVAGQEVDYFNPIPDYWDDTITEAERQRWAGNVATICRYWPGITEAELGNYLVPWFADDAWDDERKAHPEDTYAVGDAWQVSDFMRKLGLVCPMDEAGNLFGATYRFKLTAPAS